MTVMVILVLRDASESSWPVCGKKWSNTILLAHLIIIVTQAASAVGARWTLAGGAAANWEMGAWGGIWACMGYDKNGRQVTLTVIDLECKALCQNLCKGRETDRGCMSHDIDSGNDSGRVAVCAKWYLSMQTVQLCEILILIVIMIYIVGRSFQI